ncbi:unnamed protein product [Rotaria sp. Silwood1]|nr:unnamed protein product [Rotaria sp. Silwood1]
MRQYYSLLSLIYHLTFIFLIIIVGQINDVHANQINLKQSYCRDLRDCQTYFPCAVFSSGFSYLYVIKRCPNEQIFDESKQKCIKNTFTDPACSKPTAVGKARLTTIRPSNLRQIKRNNDTIRRNIKVPLRAPSINVLKRKNFDINQIEERNLHEEKPEQLITESSPIQINLINDNTKINRVCYITNWSRYRTGEAKFEIEYIDPFMCSHIIYAYATVEDNKPEIKPIQKEDIEHYRELALLKKTNPDLKLSIRLGGKSAQYTRYLKSSKMAAQLVRSLIWYMTSYGFDGVDIAFEFPDEEAPEDKVALTTLLEEISKQKRLMTRAIVTLTVAPFVDHLLKAYEVQKIEKLVNYINLMTFDFYGPWDDKTGVFAPLYHQSYQVESESLRNVVNIKLAFIYPATPLHVKKYSKKQTCLISETSHCYETIVRSYIEQNQLNAQWVYNIVDGKSERERILLETNEFILLPDIMWDGKAIESLHLLALVKTHNIHSIRDLKSEHIPMLESLLEKTTNFISSKYDISPKTIRAFFHYPPTFYHLHVHFTTLQNRICGCEVERAHLLQDVIDHLKLKNDYYQTKTLYYKVAINDPLYKLLEENQQTKNEQ